MRSSVLQSSILVCGCLLVGIVLTIWADKLSPTMLLAALVGVAGGFVVFRQPFLGLVVVVSYIQVDAIPDLILGDFSKFGLKVLTLLTLASLIFVRENRAQATKKDTAPIAEPLLVLLILVLLLSVLFAYDLDLALDSFRRFVGILILCFLVIALTDTVRRFEVLLFAIMITTIVSSFIIIYDWSFGDNLLGAPGATEEVAQASGNRSRGAYSGAAPMAATMVLCGTTLAAIFFMRIRRCRILAVATVIAGSLAIFLNATRSASLTYLVMVLWFILKFRENRVFPAMLLALLLATAVFLSLIPAEHWERMSELLEPNKDPTIYRRLSYHIIGLDLLEKFPIFGAGFGNFPVFFDDFAYRWVSGRYLDEDGVKQLHNQYLQIAAESGIIAFACYLALLGSCLVGLRGVWKRPAVPAIGFMAEALHFSFVSLLVQIAFLSNKYNKYLWIYIGLAIALHYINKAEARRPGEPGCKMDSPVSVRPERN